MASQLFVYGTLLLADNEFGHFLKMNSILIGKGKMRGNLFDAGDYPAAIASKNTDSYVYGSIFRLNNDDVLKAIDSYEGYGEGEPTPYLFVREMADIETDSDVMTCWVYLYNRSTEKLKLVPSGNYISYITKSPPDKSERLSYNISVSIIL